MKILVTGGAGYIGSFVVAELLAQGARPVVLDNLSTGHRGAVPADAPFVEGDLGDRQALDALFAAHRFHGVMHFAANTLVAESMTEPFLFLDDNYRNGLNLIETAVRHGTRRLVLSSTANLFGNPACVPIAEDETIAPGSPYGESKYLLERVLAWTDRIFGLRSAALRYFNAAGAAPDGRRGEDHRPETHLIPLVLQVALGQRDRVTVFGDDYPTADGTCVRDYVHVLDLAQAHILAYRALDQGSRTYNLGNGRGYSVRDVIETARDVTGHPIPTESGDRRPGDPAVLVAASDRIRSDLGWSPRHSDLREIIQHAWQWHRHHPDGYRP